MKENNMRKKIRNSLKIMNIKIQWISRKKRLLLVNI